MNTTLAQGAIRHRGNLAAFTLIELLVVVAIIALLIAILLPALSRAREQGKASVCGNNMHQLMLSNIYYHQENRGRLPWIAGTTNNGRNAPYNQWYQLIYLWPFMPELKLFRCPSAIDENSVKKLYGMTSDSGDPTGGSTLSGASLYFVRKSDSFYRNTARRHNWWPDQDPTQLGDQEEFPELYTEYWYNDYSSAPTAPGQQPIRDRAGKPIPQINGGNVDKFPDPAYAVPMTEFGWELPAEQLRHTGAIHLGFLDGHASRYQKRKFYDLDGRPAPSFERALDWDPYGSRPFYCWGVTKDGRDFLQ